ncbi:MAG TPA: DUF4384 domain-containing protein [Gemmatimonadales bacterium]|nr:DUF4384 domain-containing protein [Gemmatimonadales bacterium]
MLSSIAVALLLPLAAPAQPRAHIAADPPIKVRLDEDSYSRGDQARVRVRAEKDGYLVVLRADAEGHVRILYPLGPDDPGAIRGGKDFEIRGRGDRQAFTVDDRQGSGMVLAAWSAEPFHYDQFSRNGHWDYRALGAAQVGDDPESGLLDIVDGLASGHYEYDTQTYTVEAYTPRHYYSGWYGPGFYDPWYWPYYYPWGCYGCGPVIRFRAGFGGGFHPRPFVGRGFVGARHH